MLQNASKELTLSPHNDSSHQASTKHIDNEVSTSHNFGHPFANNSQQDYADRHASLRTSESKNKPISAPHNININATHHVIPEASFNSLQINHSDFNRQQNNASTGINAIVQ
jgi:hypothetical protein